MLFLYVRADPLYACAASLERVMSHLLTCETLRVSHDYSSSSRCQQQNVFQVHYKDSGRSLWRSLTPSYAVPLLKEESSQCLVNLPGMQNDKFRYPCGSPSQVSTEWTDSVVSDHPGLLASPPGRRPSTLLKTFGRRCRSQHHRPRGRAC